MGFRLCGIAVDKNFSGKFPILFKRLNIGNYKALGEIGFDDLTRHISEDDRIAVGFFGKGTLLMTGIQLMTNDALLSAFSTKQSVVAFYIDEVTSTYCFDFYRDGQYLRKKWISLTDKNIDSSDNFGPFLEIEKSESDNLEVIYKLIGSLLNIDFYEIEEDASMFIFEISKTGPESKIKKQGFWTRLFG